MITGSHNPGHYNGLKIVLDGQALSGEAITAIRAPHPPRGLGAGRWAASSPKT